MQTATEQPKKSGRDSRVDRVGMVQELERLWTKELKEQIKAKMKEAGLTLVTGDQFAGTLTAGTSSTIDAGKLFKHFKSKKITEAQLLSAITVMKKPLEEFLSREQIAAMSTTEERSPSFTVKRIEGIDLTLADIIAAITAAAPAAAKD